MVLHKSSKFIHHPPWIGKYFNKPINSLLNCDYRIVEQQLPPQLQGILGKFSYFKLKTSFPKDPNNVWYFLDCIYGEKIITPISPRIIKADLDGIYDENHNIYSYNKIVNALLVYGSQSPMIFYFNTNDVKQF